jgi:hypothetical protein
MLRDKEVCIVRELRMTVVVHSKDSQFWDIMPFMHSDLLKCESEGICQMCAYTFFEYIPCSCRYSVVVYCRCRSVVAVPVNCTAMTPQR